MNNRPKTEAGKDSMKCTVRESYLFKLWEHMLNEHGLILLDSELEEICNIAIQCKKPVSAIEIAANHGKPYICRGTTDNEFFQWAFTLEHEAQGRFKWAIKIPYGYGRTIEEAARNFLDKMRVAPMEVRRRLSFLKKDADTQNTALPNSDSQSNSQEL